MKFQPSCAGFPAENQFLSVFHLKQKRKKGSFWNLTQKLSNNGSRNSGLTHSPWNRLELEMFQVLANLSEVMEIQRKVYIKRRLGIRSQENTFLTKKKEFIGQKCLLLAIWIRVGFQCILEGAGGRERETELSMSVFVAAVPVLTAKGLWL